MERQISGMDRAASVFLGTALILVGVAFLFLGVTWIPVLGFIFGIPFVVVGIYLWRAKTYQQHVEILVGTPSGEPLSYSSLMGRDSIPVAILTTSRSRGEPFDFDAQRVNVSSVRFGPNQVSPLKDSSDPASTTTQQRDVDEDGDMDLVFMFPVRDAGITSNARELCLTGETVDGEVFFGCSSIGAAPSPA